MKIFGKELVITKKEIKKYIAILGFVAISGYAIYAGLTGKDPHDNPILDTVEIIDSAATALPDTL